jgi:hypothetical protein
MLGLGGAGLGEDNDTTANFYKPVYAGFFKLDGRKLLATKIYGGEWPKSQ